MIKAPHSSLAIRMLLISILPFTLTACSTSNSSTPIKTGYNTPRAQSELEIPPDLINSTSPQINRQSANGTHDAVLPDIAGAKVINEEGARRLEVALDAQDTWAKLVDYMQKSNLPILSESQQNGVIETDWIGDKTIKTGFAARLQNIFNIEGAHSPVNDKYRFWLEKLGVDKTAVYVEHSLLKQYIIEPKNKFGNPEVRWAEERGNTVRELEKLRELSAFFGGLDAPEATSAVSLHTQEPAHIMLAKSPETAWVEIANALRRAEYQIVDTLPNKRLYVIKDKLKEEGFWSRLSPNRKVGVKLEAISDEKTKVRATTSGGRTLNHEKALKVLYRLTSELRR